MKKLSLIFAVIFLASLSSATLTAQTQEITVDYGESFAIELVNGYDDSPNQVDTDTWSVEMCGEVAATEASGRGGAIDFSTVVPTRDQDNPCSRGVHTANVYATSTGEDRQKIGESQVTINSPKDNPHQGNYLMIQLNRNADPAELNWFFLSNQAWTNIGGGIGGNPEEAEPSKTGYILVSERDPSSGDEEAKYPVGNYLSTGDDPNTKGRVIDTSRVLADIINCGEYGGDLDTGHDNTDSPGCGVNEGDPNFGGDGDGTNDPKQIVQGDFLVGDSVEWKPRDMSKYNFDPSLISPVHVDGNYVPQGEIIVGYNQKAEVQPGAEGNAYVKRFFICRGGADSPMDGFTVDLYPGDSVLEELYRCDATDDTSGGPEDDWRGSESGTNQWTPVARCEDGLNNDGEGGIDLDDTHCGGNPNRDRETPSQCPPRIVDEVYDDSGQPVSVDGKVVLYDDEDPGNNEGTFQTSTFSGGCTYPDMDEEVRFGGEEPTQEPEKFLCRSGGAIEQYDGPRPALASNWCSNYMNLAFSTGSSVPQTPMPAVEYFIRKDALPLGESKWATDSGFRLNHGFQSLHSAEEKYSPFGDPHDPFTWDSKNMINLGGYENDNPSNYVDAWKVANATGVAEEDISGDSGMVDFRDEEVFGGGFYGECTSSTDWMYNSRWTCDYQDVSEQEIIVNPYLLEDIRDSETNEPLYGGFQINSSQIEEWALAHGVDPAGDTQREPLEIRAQCWIGAPSDKPSHNEVTNVTEEVERDSEGDLKDVHVIADLKPSSKDLNEPRSYTCQFGFSQRILNTAGTSAGLPASTNIWWRGNSEWYRPSGSPVEEAFILEGVDENGMVGTDFQTIRVPVPDSYQAPEDSKEEREVYWLKEKLSSEYSGSNPIWTHFPIADSASFAQPCEETKGVLSEITKNPSWYAQYDCGGQ